MAISERLLTSHASSECPDFYPHFLAKIKIFFPLILIFFISQFQFFSSSVSLIFLSHYGLGLQCVDSVFKIIPDLLTLHVCIPLLLLLPCHRLLLLPFFFILSHIRLNTGEFLVHMAIASVEGTRGADPQHGAVVVHSTEAELFWEPGCHVGHPPGRGRRWQI